MVCGGRTLFAGYATHGFIGFTLWARRGEVMGSYPYPLIDVGVLGYYRRAPANARMLTAMFLVVGLLIEAVAPMTTARKGPAINANQRPSDLGHGL